jgi:hypothetical protein
VAVLLQLDAVRVVLLVLVRMVVASLALLAGERDELTHVVILSEKKHVRIPRVSRKGQRDPSRLPAQTSHRADHGGAV